VYGRQAPGPATLSAAKPDADCVISNNLDRRIYRLESRGPAARSFNEPLRDKSPLPPGVLMHIGRDRAGIGTNMREGVPYKAGCPIAPLDAFALNFGARLFPRPGRKKTASLPLRPGRRSAGR